MSFRELFLELISPTICAGCNYPGTLWCDSCRDSMLCIDSRWSCKKCGAPYGYIACTECVGDTWSFLSSYSLAEFIPPLSKSIVVYKDLGERRLAQVFGRLLAEGLFRHFTYLRCQVKGKTSYTRPDLVTWIPTSEKAFRRRGFDHAKLMCEELATSLDMPSPSQVLLRKRSLDQRKLGRESRAKNTKTMFELCGEGEPRLREAHVLLVDDVFTTGATLEAAAQTLLEGGAASVRTATLARVW